MNHLYVGTRQHQATGEGSTQAMKTDRFQKLILKRARANNAQLLERGPPKPLVRVYQKGNAVLTLARFPYFATFASGMKGDATPGIRN